MLVGSRLVRLHGIDAPHRRQNCVSGVAAWACGERAARRLAELADGRDVSCVATVPAGEGVAAVCRTPERSEEHTSELQSLMRISYAVFCLKKKNPTLQHQQ